MWRDTRGGSHTRGTELVGFQIVRRLGRGGMGEVFEAVRTGPGGFRRPVALKRLTADAAIRGESIQRFLAEAAVLARLDHPNVIDVHDVVRSDDGYVIVMELLRGAPFGSVVRAAHAAGGMPAAEVLAVADQALAGLAHVHAAKGDDGKPLGLVHRDVTPGNLFVTDAGVVKLLDFGIAKLREVVDGPVTRDGEIHGTLELIAPEQARGEPADITTDLYQLAATMYWALGKRYPHGTGTAVELISRAALATPPLLGVLRPELPPAVIAVIERAMATDRTARFASADAMRAAIAPLLAARTETEPALATRVRAVLDAAAVAAAEREPTHGPAEVRGDEARAAEVRGDEPTDPAPAPPDDSAAADPAATRPSRPGGAGPRARDREPEPSAAPVPQRKQTPAPARVDRDAVRTTPETPGTRRPDRRRMLILGSIAIAIAGTATVAAVALIRDGGGASGPGPGSTLASGRPASGSTGSGSTGSGSGSAVVPVDPVVVLTASPDRPLLGVGISPDGRQLAVATGREVLRFARGASGDPISIPTALTSVDVDLIGAGTVIVTGQGEDGEWRTEPIGGPAGIRKRTDDEREQVAYAPDGLALVYSTGASLYHVAGGEQRPLVPGKSGHLITAFAWSPDGTQVAFVRTSVASPDAVIAVVDVAAPAAEPSVIQTRRLPIGEPRAFGWLDADRVVYAVNSDAGASVIALDVRTGEPTEVALEPGAMIVAGRAGGGAFAYLRATPRRTLLVGPLAGPLAAVGALAPAAIAGTTADGRLIASDTGAAPIAIDLRTTATTPLPGGAARDVVLTVADDAAIAMRAEPAPTGGLAVWRLGADPRRLAAIEHDPAITPVRCALDRAPPCVRAAMRRGAIKYVTWKPVDGTDVDDVGHLVDPTAVADHAVAADGRVAVVDGSDRIYLYATARDRRWITVPGGAALDQIAWAGPELVVTCRGWRGHPWAAIRVTLPAVGDIADAPALLDASPTGWRGVPRFADGTVVIARTDLDVVLVVRDL